MRHREDPRPRDPFFSDYCLATLSDHGDVNTISFSIEWSTDLVDKFFSNRRVTEARTSGMSVEWLSAQRPGLRGRWRALLNGVFGEILQFVAVYCSHNILTFCECRCEKMVGHMFHLRYGAKSKEEEST